MKVQLISTSFEDKVRHPFTTDSNYPLGMAYIHSYLEKQGHVVETIFLNSYSYNDCYRIVIDKLQTFNPEVVGFNILTSNRVSAYYLIEYAHKYYPNTKIILGGIHTSAMYRQLIEKYPYVVTVIGEGEATMADLVDKIQNDESIDNVTGIAFFKDNKTMVTPSRPLIEDLDQLPFPKHEIFFHPEVISASILTTRGCPFSCSFCALDLISRKTVRYRSIKSVMEELEHIKKINPNIKRIWINDDTFFIRNERVIEFCNEVIKRKLDFEFICSARFKPISEKIVPALEQAGFISVLFGLESGSPSVLKLAGKHITPQDAIHAIELFKNSLIEVGVFLIVGLSGENDITIKETIDLVMELQKIKYILYSDDIPICFVYPATQLYDTAKQAGQINDDYWLTNNPVPFYTVEHAEEQLVKYRERLLNHVTLDRILTFHGFKSQAKMIPYVMKHFAKMSFFRKIEFLNTVFYKYKVHHPRLYKLMRFFYRKLKSYTRQLMKKF